MPERYILALIILVVGVPIAWVMDRNSWRKRPREELERILRERDWRRVGLALKEIKRRGENITPYLQTVLVLLTDESVTVRTAGKIALKDYYPEIAREIPKFFVTDPVEKRNATLAPLLQKYRAD